MSSDILVVWRRGRVMVVVMVLWARRLSFLVGFRWFPLSSGAGNMWGCGLIAYRLVRGGRPYYYPALGQLHSAPYYKKQGTCPLVVVCQPFPVPGRGYALWCKKLANNPQNLWMWRMETNGDWVYGFTAD